MSASILSNVRANVMTEQQQLVCSKAEKCGLQGFCIELSDQFSSPELYSSLSFEDRMNQCLDRELDNMSVKKFNNLYRNSRIDRRIYLEPVSAKQLWPLPQLLRRCRRAFPFCTTV